MNRERADMLQPLINLRPGIITNNRLGGGYPGDTETPEQHIPATGYKDRDWETCMTMNDTWGYKSYDNNWKSVETLIRNLVDIASKGGNYLLNVGPTAEGEIPAPSVERLKAIGQWMKVNGDSIYGTAASPFTRLTWGRCTKKTGKNGATLYLHVFDWPAEGALVVPGLKNQVQQAWLLANHQKLETASSDMGVTIQLPPQPLDEIDTVVVLKVAGPLNVEKVLPTQNDDGSVMLSAVLADIHNPGYGTHAKLEAKDGMQNIGFWTDPRAWIEWPFKLSEKGEFYVKADVAIEAEQSVFEIIIDGQSTTAKVVSTGGYDNFQNQQLSKMAVLKAGEHKLQIKPVKDQWQPVNFRSITLEPAQ
jgi:alpha-L-fucosidase